MSQRLPFSLLHALNETRKSMVSLPCPGCAGQDRRHVWSHDRYFLKVDLSICRACGLAHLARGLAGSAAQRFYNVIYPRLMGKPLPVHLARAHIEATFRLKVITDVVGPIDSLLEIGSGRGFFLDAYRTQGGRHFLGLEPGERQRRFATDTLGLGTHIRAEPLSERTEAPFTPQLIALFHVLEHLDDPGSALDRLRQLIDPRGWLVLEVPDILADWRTLGLWQVHVSHRSYFSAATLGALLERHGFTPVYICREPDGIHEGNLRLFARPSPAEACPATPAAPDEATQEALARSIVEQIRPLSLHNGYPRAAVRLLRLATRDSRP